MIYKQERIIDGSRGIYVPQFFAEIWPDMVKYEEDLNTLLTGPDAPCYQTAWDSVLDTLGPSVDSQWIEQGEAGDVFLCLNIEGLESDLLETDEELTREALYLLYNVASIEEIRHALMPSPYNTPGVNARLEKLQEIIKQYM